jgi:fructose-1,6-bisphosphatase I
MAFLVENGGGRAITGAGRVLDLQPAGIHERCPIFLGSKQDVDRIEALYSGKQ